MISLLLVLVFISAKLQKWYQVDIVKFGELFR